MSEEGVRENVFLGFSWTCFLEQDSVWCIINCNPFCTNLNKGKGVWQWLQGFKISKADVQINLKWFQWAQGSEVISFKRWEPLSDFQCSGRTSQWPLRCYKVGGCLHTRKDTVTKNQLTNLELQCSHFTLFQFRIANEQARISEIKQFRF